VSATRPQDRALQRELPGGARILFTTRAQGSFAIPPEASQEDRVAVRERVLALTGTAGLARGRQVHGVNVRRIRLASDEGSAPLEELPEEPADGQATTLRGTALMVISADCLPVALACGDAVAMLHAGWRGLAAGVLEQGVLAVRELASHGGPLHAVIGPGAGPCCYEVGPEVHAAFGRSVDAGGFACERPTPIDLRAIARERLLAAGVDEVEAVEVCTICDERFYSHRREGKRAGRQAGIAWLS
jgi:YfiH family protein